MIKQPILFFISVLILPLLLYFVFDRLVFITSAVRSSGSVISLSSSNTTCGSNKSKYSCTKFSALVEFPIENSQPGRIAVSAGSARGHNNPVTRANYEAGSRVPVLYNPKNPAEAYRDTLFDLWAAPFFALIAQIATFFGAMAEPKKSRRYRIS